MSLPLLGTRVLDFGDEAMVLASRLLADLGADVIRVEAADGDYVRRRGPLLDRVSKLAPEIERGFAHIRYNAGKRSLALALGRPEAWSLVDMLAATADVLIAPIEPTPLAAAFFSEAHLRAVAPAAGVVDAVFRRGSDERAVIDLLGSAAGGQMYLNGYEEDPPNVPGGKLAYKQTSIAAAFAAMSLVLQRAADPSGSPGRITVSMQEAMMWTTIQSANENYWPWHRARQSRKGLGNLGGQTIYATRDGRWVSFVQHPPYWPNFVEWIAEALGDARFRDPAWKDPRYRFLNHDQSAAATTTLCLTMDRDELVREGQSRSILVVPVQTVRDIANDRHLRERGFYQRVDYPQFGGEVEAMRPPFISTAYEVSAGRAPMLGEHSREILAQLSHLDAATIDNLIAEGLVVAASNTIDAVPLSLGERVGVRVDADTTMRLRGRVNSGLRPQGSGPRAPLAGCRIIDFCWMIAGPLTTRLLGDLGAEVIKVESMARLDRIREVGVQPPEMLTPDTNGVFNDCNPNKLSIMLNLGHPKGIELAKELVKTADVVTSNFTPDRMDRWGLGYADLKAVKEDIIVASLPVMGTLGQHSSWRAVGNGVIAMGGLNGLTGFPERPPVGLGTLHSDFTTPYFGALQIAAAVHQRNLTGKGQYMELAQYEATVHLLDTEVIEFLNNGSDAARRGNRSREHVPHGVFPTLGDDRWVALAARDDGEWRRLCTILELPVLAARADLATLEGRKRAASEIEAAIAARTADRDAWELSKQLQSAGIPASPVEDVGDLVGRDLAQRGFFKEIQHPAGVSMLLQHEPITWDGARLPLERAPLLGEHSASVFNDLLGIGANDLAELVVEGVVY